MIKIEKVILYGIVAILLINALLRRCQPQGLLETKPKVTIVRDTVWQVKTDTFQVQTVAYKTVYVAKDDTDEVLEQAPEERSEYTEAKAYRDTLSTNDIDIFSYDLVEGSLLDSQISYRLKVPREITVTKTIEHPKTYRSGLYLFSEVGGNSQVFSNLSFGVQYNRKGKWFISYRANLNTGGSPTHNLGVGFRLFK